jgi:hypothetical protein
MKHESDPTRWIDDASDSPEPVRHAMRIAAGYEPTQGDLDRLSASLGAALAVPVVAATAGSSAAVGAKSGAIATWFGLKAKVIVGLCVIGMAGGTVYVAHRAATHADHAPQTPHVAVTSPISRPTPMPMPMPAPAQTETATQEPSTIVAPAPAQPTARHTARASSATSAAGASDARELVVRAQAALAQRDANLALALTEEHRARFPHASNAEERERIAIEALARLGRTGAAHERATRFFVRFPHSVYRARIESLVPQGGT